MALQVKRCTEETRKSSTTVLQEGQPLYTMDTNKLYIGDGNTEAKNLQGTHIGLNIENGTGKHSIIQVPLQYGKNEDSTLKYGNIATGSDAIALGISSEATNSRAVAIGNGAKALANTSFVIGQVNTAETDASGTFIGGNSNTGSTQYSFIFGTKNKMISSGAVTKIDCSANLISGDSNTLTDAHASSIIGSNNTSGRLTRVVDGKKERANNNHIFGSENVAYGQWVCSTGRLNKASGWYLDQIGFGNFARSASSNYFYNPNRPDKTKVCLDDPSPADVPLYHTHQLGNNLIVGRWHTTQIGEYNHTNKYNAIEFGVNVSPNLDKPEDNPIRSTPLSITRQGKALYGVPYQTYCQNGEDVFEKDIRSSDFNKYELANHGYVDETTQALALNFEGILNGKVSELQTSIDTNIGDVRGELNDLTGYVDNKDAQTLTGAKNYTNSELDKLDHSFNSDVSQTITYIGQNNGHLIATINPIQIDKSQVTDLEQDITGLYTACDNLETDIDNVNRRIDNVSAGIVPISYDAENGILIIG